MDPLSVTASVVGLIGAAAKIYGMIEYISSAKDAPTTLREAEIEVKHIEIALRSLQRYLWHLGQIDARRRECIQLNDLIIALSDAMRVFYDFENLLVSLARLTRLRVAISWFMYAKQIDEHIVKTQRNKSTLVFMLNILQCQSDMEASQSQERLQTLVEQILADNNDLRQRLSQMQDTFDARSTFTKANAETNMTRPYDEEDREDNLSILTEAYRHTAMTQSTQAGTLNTALERILEQSWVYKRNRNGECDRSFIHSDQRSHAWSCFTGYSLADVSVLSMVSMPITQVDIKSVTSYNFDVVESYDSDDTPQPGLSYAEDGSKGEEISPKGVNSLPVPSKVQKDDPQASTWPHVDRSAQYRHTNTEATSEPWSRSLQMLEPDAGTLPYTNDAIFNDFKRNNQCHGCSKTLEAGKAWELLGYRWHLDCYRCTYCNVLFDAQADIYPLQDGKLICDKCFCCSECGNGTKDLAILAGDQAFCAECFAVLRASA
ncbi:hypothetical protein PFICI_11731 [Pestalotiopsis fici W106-1]|uniref:LIM zinc-binding domain-containing protein n=1 Tax=Pestalotiopsis fici (strain W106-1 / CGMCC3.15140) TaxID=1229662 RepID=W3WR79_PESFW|nr:uncharacterized protein PFICI_11731 [Pestalotiopsis fici W106-1]ETS76344.1 hypothetical protein PFICI_11731 [Pestalotiopsis fici W106-1]